MPKPVRKRGRPAQYVNGRDGKPIVGLSLKSDGRFYATHSKPRVYLDKDFDSALIQFLEWEAKQKRETVTVTESPPINLADANQTGRYLLRREAEAIAQTRIDPQEGVLSYPIDSAAFWATVRKAIQNNPYLAAERTGLAEVMGFNRSTGVRNHHRVTFNVSVGESRETMACQHFRLLLCIGRIAADTPSVGPVSYSVERNVFPKSRFCSQAAKGISQTLTGERRPVVTQKDILGGSMIRDPVTQCIFSTLP